MKNLSKVSVIVLAVLSLASCASVSKSPVVRSEVKVQESDFTVVQFKDSKVFTVIPSKSK